MSILFDEWDSKRIFKVEKDRFKNKKYIYTSPLKVTCQGFNNFNLYPFIASDIISKKYRMQGYNVLYPIVINNLSEDTLNYSRLRGESFNALNDYFIRELKDMNVGFDSEKEISFSNPNFIKFVQIIFNQMVADDVITLKKLECYTDFSGHTIYPRYKVALQNDKYVLKETGESVYGKTLDVFAIEIKKLDGLLDAVKSLDCSDDIKNEIYDILDCKKGMYLPFKSHEKNVELYAHLKNPEYMAGISFIALNPKYMDVMKYTSDDEYIVISDFINDVDSEDDVFTGLVLKNPLSFKDIYVFASYKYDEAVHVGIPEVDTLDYMFASHVGVDIERIIEDDVLINSDLLNGMNPIDARDVIIDAFTSEGMAEEYIYPNREEVIISCNEDLGVIIPSVVNYMGDVSILDEKFYPVYYSNRFKPIITNEDRLEANLSLKRQVFNEGFILGLSSIYSKVYDVYAGNDEYLSIKSTYDDFTDIEGVLYELSCAQEIFYNLVFIEYFKRFDKKNASFSKVSIVDETIDSSFLGEQQRLGISFVNEILNKYSSDAYRLYLMSEKLNNELAITLTNVEKYESLLDRIKIAYSKEFEEYDYENQYTSDFIKESIRLLDHFELAKFASSLVSFFESFVETRKITKKESYKYLILLSLVAPELCEKINKDIFKERYSIFYNELPR